MVFLRAGRFLLRLVGGIGVFEKGVGNGKTALGHFSHAPIK